GLTGAIPRLFFQRGGMGPLLVQRIGVAVRQTEQVTTTEIDQQATENQAEQQKTADQRRGDHFRRVGSFRSDLPFMRDEVIKQQPLLFLQFQPTLAAYVLDHWLVLRATCNRFLGESDPLVVQLANTLDST